MTFTNHPLHDEFVIETVSGEKYHPDLNRPAVQKRLRSAIGKVLNQMSPGKEKVVSRTLMTLWFGQTQNDLSYWLKHTLLFCSDHYYSIDNGISKKYIRNEAGVNYVIDLLHSLEPVVPEVIHKSKTELELELAITEAETEYANDILSLQEGTAVYVLKSNRYFFSIQNIRREVKKLVLSRAGFNHQYDIQCCAPTLLYQLAQKNGLDEYLPAISSYLADRTKIRNEISTSTSIPVGMVKRIITSLFSGAILSRSGYCIIYKMLDYDDSLMYRLQKNEFLIQLRKDISKMWFVLSRTVMYRTKVKNERTGKETFKPVSSKQKWAVYFRLEKSIIDSVLTFIKDANTKALIEHDGWSTMDKLDTDLLISHIKQVTGYKVKLDYDYITHKEQPSSITTKENFKEENRVVATLKGEQKQPSSRGSGVVYYDALLSCAKMSKNFIIYISESEKVDVNQTSKDPPLYYLRN